MTDQEKLERAIQLLNIARAAVKGADPALHDDIVEFLSMCSEMIKQ